MLTFEPVEHIYEWDGVHVPNITSCLPYKSYGDNSYAMDKGTLAHKMIHLYNQNDLVEPVDATLQPYLDAYKDFQDKECIVGICDIKTGVPHPCTTLQLAGQHLLVNEGVGMMGISISTHLPVYEEPLYHPTYRFAGTPDIVTGLDRVYALYLNDKGKYKVVDHTKELRKSTGVFLAKITSYKWDKENNLL